MRLTKSKDLNKFLEEQLKNGSELLSVKNHVKIRTPDGIVHIISKSPNSSRNLTTVKKEFSTNRLQVCRKERGLERQ